MRSPLQKHLSDQQDLAQPQNRDEAEERLKALFVKAQGEANAYTAERLEEVYEVAERALALASAFPPELPEADEPPGGAWYRRIPSLVSSYGAGLLLAACAPLVAEASLLLASACGVAAALSLAFPRRGGRAGKPLRLPPPNAPQEKFDSLISAADRSLQSMTSPRALEAPAPPRAAVQEDDVLSLLQETLMLKDAENRALQDLASNAERLAARLGYDVIWDEDTEHFEMMVDPDVQGTMLLRPALVHRTQSNNIIFGVVVRGRA